jgi:mRNA interferase MazF
VELSQTDFKLGSLQRTSYARPGKLFTASGRLAVRQVGTLNPAASKRIVSAVIRLLLPRQ